MAATQQDIDKLTAFVNGLNQAIADGVRQVTLGEQTITYNTTDSLITARDDMLAQLRAAKAELAAASDPAPKGRIMYLRHGGRGY